MLQLVGLLVPAISKILDKIIPDKDKANELAHEIATAVERQAHEQIMAQIEVNKAQAQHGSIFVAGARPFIMWVCGLSMAWTYLLYPFALWITWLFPEYQDVIQSAPKLDDGAMMTVLLGLLGLGGMRSYEKKNGVARNSLKAG